MNYQSLKGMIESLIKSYKCPECSKTITETNIDIIGAAGNTINIDVECNECGKHSMIKTEVLSIDLTNKQITLENLKKIKETISKNSNLFNNNSIKDEEIINLNRNLKKRGFNVADLLGENK